MLKRRQGNHRPLRIPRCDDIAVKESIRRREYHESHKDRQHEHRQQYCRYRDFSRYEYLVRQKYEHQCQCIKKTVSQDRKKAGPKSSRYPVEHPDTVYLPEFIRDQKIYERSPQVCGHKSVKRYLPVHYDQIHPHHLYQMHDQKHYEDHGTDQYLHMGSASYASMILSLYSVVMTEGSI